MSRSSKTIIMYTAYSSFEDLTSAASKYLKDIGKSKQTISIYEWIWKKVKMYMDENRLLNCTSATVSGYLTFIYGNQSISKLSRHQKHCVRCALCLAQFAETSNMVEVIRRREPIVFTGELGKQMENYIDHKKSFRLHKSTLRAYCWYLYQFYNYLNQCDIHSPKHLSPLHIMRYAAQLLPNEAGARHLALSIIKKFLRYLYDEEITFKDLSLLVPKDNYVKQPKLPSTYTREEITVILNSIDRSTPTGKRDYVIILFAVRLGMRASDISKIVFSDLLWSQNKIVFKQHKTQETVELYLPADVGEPLIDYIKYARPVSEYKNVFLERLYPHGSIDPKRISRIASRTIVNSGVDVGKRRHGSHALRHTMASLLLQQKTSLPVISELLGHSSIQSSMCYLRIDTELLRQCALNVPPIPEAFYTQKGGAFYA